MASLPVFYGVAGATIVHELGHRTMAAAEEVKLGMPIFIPNGQLGTFGSVTPVSKKVRV